MKDKKKIEIILLFIIAIFFFILIILPKKKTEVKIDSYKNYIVNPRKKLDKDVLKVGVPLREKPLNVFDDGDGTVSLLSRLIHPSLLYKDKNDKAKLEIAEEYWYEDLGKTISVKLKKDYKFSNGELLTAKNVYNTYLVLADPSYSGKYVNYVNNLKGYFDYKLKVTDKLHGIEVLGDYFIKFHFNDASFSNIYSLMFPIVNIKKTDFRYNDLSKVKYVDLLNGAGRYKVENIVDENIKLILKDNKKNKDIKIKKIEISFWDYRDAMHKFQSGELDILYKYPKGKNFYRDYNERTRQYSNHIDFQSVIFNFIGFNQKSNIFKNENYRRALRDSIEVKKIFEEKYGKDVYDFPEIPVYKNSWFNSDNYKLDRKNNLSEELSKKYKRQGKYFIDKNGEYITVKLAYMEEDSFANDIKEYIVNEIENEGIKVKLKSLSPQEMYKHLNDEDEDYDIYISQGRMTEIPSYQYDNKNKESKYENINTLLDTSFYYILEKIREDVYSEELNKLTYQWKKNFDKTTPYIVLSTENITSIINKRVKGIYINEFIGLSDIENLKNIEFTD
ncbi:ABC transporter substrate-binding protein [Helcococcus ovis]|uniref:ABC transporter substrate-binding protein n=2 Tax=Helcococcus ovis TaxID=72026 RepID=UPI001070557F|nr:ABC transporter substrate-binding protein [Helcococcus ovis]TFF68596.1 hypothetical protein EQF93_01730 [Helcococcus ovis]WNZ01323.1 ABC transporter substrate-binding protein [Helcococcus ovis]